MNFIEELKGYGDYANRSATISSCNNALHVEMYDELGLALHTIIRNKTLRYAEDCAENWVTGVLHND